MAADLYDCLKRRATWLFDYISSDLEDIKHEGLAGSFGSMDDSSQHFTGDVFDGRVDGLDRSGSIDERDACRGLRSEQCHGEPGEGSPRTSSSVRYKGSWIRQPPRLCITSPAR